MSVKKVVETLAHHKGRGKKTHHIQLHELDDGSVHMKHHHGHSSYPMEGEEHETSHKSFKHAAKHIASLEDADEMHESGVMIGKKDKKESTKEGESGY